MAEPINTYRPDVVSAPGDTLADLLDERGMTQAELATRLGRPRKTINEIVKGKAAIEPETALQLEAVLGTPASFWLAREARYREWLARRRRQGEMEAAREWAAAFPYAEMARWGWVPGYASKHERGEALLRFFGVASPKAWNAVWAECEVFFRKPTRLAARRGALAAWLRRGELEAFSIDCAPFDRERFLLALDEARAISLAPPDEQPSRLATCLAAAGVAFVVVPEVRGSGVCGATRWLSDTQALIQVSLRYRSDDQLFFSVFHEAAHLLLHPRRAIYIEGPAMKSPEETEADVFAADLLIPPDRYEKLVRESNPLPQVLAFARSIGIAPGLVVGRLQRDGRVPSSRGNRWKRPLAWKVEGNG